MCVCNLMTPLQMEEGAALYSALSNVSHSRGTDQYICTMEDCLPTKSFHQQDTIATGRPNFKTTISLNHKSYLSKMTRTLYKCFDAQVSRLAYAYVPKFSSTAPLSALLSKPLLIDAPRTYRTAYNQYHTYTQR